MIDVEFYKDPESGSRSGRAWLQPCMFAAAATEGLRVTHSASRYRGNAEWLVLMGIGDPRYHEARDRHVESGRPVAVWDMGYFGKSKDTSECYMRVSINSDHPTPDGLENTATDAGRFKVHGLTLRQDYDPRGQVVVVGMGPKGREYYFREAGWEERALQSASKRFPDRRVVYRSKPRVNVDDHVAWPYRSAEGPIETVLSGASLVICRHSNVAVDACIAGVPVECEAGAAHWLYSRHPIPTPEQRRDFLYRLAHWQYRIQEADMRQAWLFLLSMWSKLK